jgi:hypothetical protein
MDDQIPPRSEWRTLSATQLYDVKGKMSDMYYKMRGINATFANQYASFLSQLDQMIQLKEIEDSSEKDE